MVICLNYGHLKKKLRSVIVSQNHYINQNLDVHPLCNVHSCAVCSVNVACYLLHLSLPASCQTTGVMPFNVQPPQHLH